MFNLGNRFAQHSFAVTPSVNTPRSLFDRSSTAKDTLNFDYLNPIYCEEILPGDTMNLTLKSFCRLTPTATKVPIMDRMYLDFFFFFVPNRLVWPHWEKLCGAQDNPGDSIAYAAPQLSAPAGTGFTNGSIYDKFGLPTGISNLLIKNCMPLRGYNLIFNTWFRDQNMQDSVVVKTGDGPDVSTDYTLLKRGKRHDYFTSCLTSPQKGTAQSLPLGTSAPVVLNPTLGISGGWKRSSDHGVPGATENVQSNGGTVYLPTSAANAVYDPFTSLYADLSAATAATINQLRQAFQIQSLLELDMRGGTRYVEILLAHFNVVSPDFRLQRPEYLGGGSTDINSNPVPQTSPTSGSNPQGQLAAFATQSTLGKNIGFTKSFVEHGYVIGLACARADITYQQGLERHWNRSTRYDWYWPKLGELGEQSVLNKEIYCNNDANDDLVFGYQERNAEYRYKPSQIRGQFRSNYSTPLDSWHLAQSFASLPTLGNTFIQQNTPIDRTLAITGSVQLLCDFWFQCRHARPMTAYAVPAHLGRF